MMNSILLHRGAAFRPAGPASLSLACLFTLLALPVSAATIIHYRFEDPNWLVDSSGNSHTLTARSNPTGGTNPAQYTLPASGAGSAFPNPVPQNGLSNLDAATFNGTGWLTAADNDAFTSSTFTIEAFVNASDLDLGYTPFIASHFQGAHLVNQRSWALAVNRNNDGTNDGQLQMILSKNGETGGGNTAVILSGSSLAMVAGKDYYVAASVSLGAAAADRSITFYLQNLTDGGSLLTSTVSHGIESLHNSTAAFAVGGQGVTSGTGASLFQGVIDEVRFSNTVLSQNELLAIPEPGTLLLLGLSGVALLVTRRFART